jgi:hypothetical protein
VVGFRNKYTLIKKRIHISICRDKYSFRDGHMFYKLTVARFSTSLSGTQMKSESTAVSSGYWKVASQKGNMGQIYT